MGSLKELHDKFLLRFPNRKISLSIFTKLRPQFCILAGAKGTHNVCVCKIHQNMRLKVRGLKQELGKVGVNYETTYRDLLKKMTCSLSNSDCCLSMCDCCPGASKVIEEIESHLSASRISQVSYSQWLTTDR